MRAALTLLTVFGRSTEPTPRAWTWFPVVGAGLGALVGGAWWLAEEAFPVLLGATLVVIADLAVTGMLHVDGLADAADGLLCHATRSERLRIMHTPDLGAFGATVVAVTLLTRVSAFAVQPVSIALVAVLWCASRTVIAVAPAWLPYVREDGIAAPMLTRGALRWPLVALLPAAGVAMYADGVRGAAAITATVLGAAGVLALARHRVGGFTGDVLGAGIVVGETVGLVVGAARW
jgi:adenosylcobinamide-GDP ribazoletransferase